MEQHVAALNRDLGITGDQTADMALRYVLDNSAVSTVIAGMRTIRNVERNISTSDGRPLTSEQRVKLQAHRWERNFYLPV